MKYFKSIIIMLIFFSLCGCADNKNNKTEPLSSSDFRVPDTNFAINELYTDDLITEADQAVDLTKAPSDASNNLVSEDFEGEYMYKTYWHEYDGITIYDSNKHYNQKNKSMHDFYIIQIVLDTDKYATSRNISVGMSADDITEAYGFAEKQEKDNVISMAYYYENMALKFILDESEKVTTIVMSSNG